MGSGSAGANLPNQLNILLWFGVVGDLSDGQLVQRFLTARDGADQAAFTALVERHGPMVREHSSQSKAANPIERDESSPRDTTTRSGVWLSLQTAGICSSAPTGPSDGSPEMSRSLTLSCGPCAPSHRRWKSFIP
jgi:hypothetical protein